MKRFLAFLMPLLLFLGCEEIQPAPEAMITLDSEQADNIHISSEGDTFEVSFISVLDWTAGIEYESGGEGWASLNKTSGKGGYDIARLKVLVQNNQKSEKRSAKLVISSGDKKVKISFAQDGYEEPVQETPVFKISDREAEVGAEGGRIQVTVEFNVDYYHEISADWIKEVDTKAVDSKVHTFEIAANTSESIRTGVISFCGNYTCISFTVIQAAGEPEPYMEVDTESLMIPSEGTAEPLTVKVSSNVGWTVSSDASWVSVDPKSGDGDGLFAVSADVNENTESRTATIKVSSSDGTISRSLVVLQEAEAKVFTLNDEVATVGADGGVIYVTVSHNVDYRCEIYADWIKEINTKTIVDDVHAFEISPNTVEESRSAVISFVGDGETISFTVTQEAWIIPIFELLENSAELEAEGGLVTVAVNANIEYDYTITADWVREVQTRSVNMFEHTFEVLENTEPKDRTAVISFCGNDNCLPFTITQKGYQPTDKLEVDVKDISAAASGTVTPYVVNVESDTDWNVISDASWCTVDPSSGTGNGSFMVSIAENASSEPRTAIVAVTVVDGSTVRKIGIIQAPKASGSGDDSWKSNDFIHKSLALRFTADWCGYCPMMAAAMAKAQGQLPDKLEVISVHGGGSGLANETSNALTDFYGIGGFPTGYVDGMFLISNGDIPTTTANIVAAVNQTEEEYDTYTGVSWTSSVSGNQIILNLSAYIKKAGSYKVTALLVEDNIVGYQADNTNGSSYYYVHKGVLRAAFSDVLGESFDITEDLQQKNFAYSVEVPSGCVVDNMRIVVFIQRKDGRYYVDNTASASVGKYRPLATSSGNWGSGNEGIVPGDDITI